MGFQGILRDSGVETASTGCYSDFMLFMTFLCLFGDSGDFVFPGSLSFLFSSLPFPSLHFLIHSVILSSIYPVISGYTVSRA